MRTLLFQLRHLVRLVMLRLPFGEALVKSIDKRILARQRVQRSLALRTHWREIFMRLHEGLKTAGVSYWLDFGSLLGLIRENGVIGHDEDVDCCVPPDTDLKKVYHALKGCGFVLCHGFSVNGDLTEISLSYRGVGVDFFRCHCIGDMLGYYCCEADQDIRTCQAIKYVAHDRKHAAVSRIIERCFDAAASMSVCVPENYDEVLTLNYGNWRVPDKKTNYCGKNVPSHYRDIQEGCRLLTAEELLKEYGF